VPTLTRKLVFMAAAASLWSCDRVPLKDPVTVAGASLSITSPSSGTDVDLDNMSSVDVTYAVENFRLSLSCDQPSCGYVRAWVDWNACDDSGLRYNALSTSDRISLRLDSCPTPAGAHHVVIALFTRDDAPVVDERGNAVTASLDLTAWGRPSLSVTSPADGASVPLGQDPGKSVPIAFSVENMTLKAPGTCAGSFHCGHVRVERTLCAVLTAFESPVLLPFAGCQFSIGSQVVKVSLRHDDGSAYELDGIPVEDFVSFTTM